MCTCHDCELFEKCVWTAGPSEEELVLCVPGEKIGSGFPMVGCSRWYGMLVLLLYVNGPTMSICVWVSAAGQLDVKWWLVWRVCSLEEGSWMDLTL